MLPELLLPNQENRELLLLVELPELEDASEPEELLVFVVDFSEACPWFVPAEPPYGLVVELFPVCPGLFKPDPLKLLLGFNPKNDVSPSFDPGLVLLVPLEPLE